MQTMCFIQMGDWQGLLNIWFRKLHNLILIIGTFLRSKLMVGVLSSLE